MSFVKNKMPEKKNWIQGPRGGLYRVEKLAGGKERKVYKKKSASSEKKAGRWRTGAALASGVALGAIAGAAAGPYPYGYYYPWAARPYYRGRYRYYIDEYGNTVREPIPLY